jgi:hypothetical protein
MIAITVFMHGNLDFLISNAASNSPNAHNIKPSTSSQQLKVNKLQLGRVARPAQDPFALNVESTAA